MESPETIKEHARRLDAALEAKDIPGVVRCFAEDCEIELLGVKLKGHDGIRRWLAWLFQHASSVAFEPRVIMVEGQELFEEFTVNATLHSGRELRSHQAEVLTYRDGLVTSLRLYLNPLDFARAAGVMGRLAAPLLTRLARKGLPPFEELD